VPFGDHEGQAVEEQVGSATELTFIAQFVATIGVGQIRPARRPAPSGWWGTASRRGPRRRSVTGRAVREAKRCVSVDGRISERLYRSGIFPG
jgi:hypothetical protein